MNNAYASRDYFPYSVQIRQTLWKQLSLAELHQDIKASNKPRIMFYRELAARLLARGVSVTAGELNLYALSLRIQRFLIKDYLDKESTRSVSLLLADAGIPPGSPALAAFAGSFCRAFPVGPFLDNPQLDPVLWLEAEPAGDRHQLIIAEMLLLSLAAENRALDGFRDLLDPAELFQTGDCGIVVRDIVRSLAKSPPLTPTGLTLPEFLRLPLQASPASLYGQLEYMKANWQRLLPEELLPEIFGAFAIMKEEWGLFAPQGEQGPSPVLEFGLSARFPGTNDYYPEPERFSDDTDWMPNVVLLAKMVYDPFPVEFYFGKNFRIRLKNNLRAGCFGATDFFNFVLRFSALIFLDINASVLVDFSFKPGRQSINNRNADAMQTAGDFI